MGTKNDIDQIICDKILGVITPEDEKILGEWLAASVRHRTDYETFMKRRNLTSRYETYCSVEYAKAWSDFKHRNMRQERTQWALHMLKYAAALILIIISVYIWNINDVTREPQPERLTASVERAIGRLERSGRHKAMLSIDGGAAVSVTSVAEYKKALEEVPADVTNVLTTNDGKEFWVTLDDGTRVHLGYGSRLKYPASFNGKMRVVSLEGEAYFKVAHDIKRPFIVVTPHGDIKEYGTEFVVNTRGRGDMTEIVLIEGSISVRARGRKERMMKPGEKATLSASSMNVEYIDVAPYEAWNEGEYIFNDTRLDELMSVLCHWYNLKAEYTDEETRGIRFTGSVDRYGNIDSILKAVSKVSGVTIVREGEKILIK